MESETLLARPVAEPPKSEPEPPPPPPPSLDERRRVLASRLRQIRRFPFVQLFAYYLLLTGVVALLMGTLPALRRAFISPIVLPALSNMPTPVERVLAGSVERGLTTLLVTLGALALVLPVAWVYTFTKRLRYDPSLVQSVIILPIVVTGILLIVKNSLALAFSLAGIVAAVRFRNTLKDPKDAVYIFLALGIGIAAGVQALDVGLVMSLVFNVMVLLLWKFNVGSIYNGWHGRSAAMWATSAPGLDQADDQFLSVGDPGLMIAQMPENRREIKKRLRDRIDGMRTDGILLIHSAEVDLARDAVEDTLDDLTREWKLAEVSSGEGGNSTAEYLVRLRKKTNPADLLGALDERWASQVAAAEYIAYKKK